MPTAPDLTTLANVRAHMQISDATDTTQDTLISSLITAASVALSEYAQREFNSAAAAETARDFRYDGRGVMSLAPYDLNTIDSVQIDVDGASPSPTTLTADDYRAMPIGKPNGVWHSMHLRGFTVGESTSAAKYPTFRVVRITGDWGFPSVPAPVERACILTVVWMLTHSSQHMGDEFGMNVPFTGERLAIPGAAKRLLDPYRRRGF